MKSRRFVLFVCLLGLIALPAAAVDLTFNGSVGMRTKYTPELAWQIEKSLYLTSKLDFGDKITGIIGFSGLGFENQWRPIFEGNDSLDLTIDRISLSTKAPFFAVGTPFVTTMGDLKLNYSPYGLRLDDALFYKGQWINPRKRGAAISNLILPTNWLGLLANKQIQLDAALFWDNDHSQRYRSELSFAEPAAQRIRKDGIAYAAHLKAEGGNSLVKFTAVNFSGKIEKFLAGTENSDVYELVDQAFILELDTEFGRGTALKATAGRNEKHFQYHSSQVAGQTIQRPDAVQEISSAGDLLLVELSRDLGTWQLAFGYQFLEPQFDPEYRDRTPRYDEEGRKLAWNPIDRLAARPGVVYGSYEEVYDPGYQPWGKKGGYLKVDASLGAVKLTGLLDNYQVLRTESGAQLSYSVLNCEFQMPFVWDSEAKFICEQILKREQAQDGRVNISPTDYLAVELTRPIYKSKSSNWDLIGIYELEDDYEEPVTVVSRSGFLSYSAAMGRLMGLNFEAGVTCETLNTIDGPAETIIPKMRLSYRLPSGISVTVNWANPNRADRKLYDRFGDEYLGEDNVFECRLRLEF